MKSILFCLFSLLFACSNQEQAGIMITGNTISSGPDTIHVKGDYNTTQTNKLKNNLNSKPYQTLAELIQFIQPASYVSWSFDAYSNSNYSSNLAGLYPLNIQGQISWTDLGSGSIMSSWQGNLKADSTPFEGQNEIALAMQFMPWGETQSQQLLQWGSPAQSQMVWILENQQSLHVILIQQNDTIQQLSIPIQWDQWNHIKITLASHLIQVYQRDTLRAQALVRAWQTPKSSLEIAGAWNFSTHKNTKTFDGLIDYLAIWNQPVMSHCMASTQAYDFLCSEQAYSLSEFYAKYYSTPADQIFNLNANSFNAWLHQKAKIQSNGATFTELLDTLYQFSMDVPFYSLCAASYQAPFYEIRQGSALYYIDANNQLVAQRQSTDTDTLWACTNNYGDSLTLIKSPQDTLLTQQSQGFKTQYLLSSHSLNSLLPHR